MNKLKAYDVILSPVITEKATQVSEANQVIDRTATGPALGRMLRIPTLKVFAPGLTGSMFSAC